MADIVGNSGSYASKFCSNLILICYICPNSPLTFAQVALLQYDVRLIRFMTQQALPSTGLG